MVDLFIAFLTFVEVIVALLLIGVILIQQSKAGGGLGAMSGAVTETFLGAGAGNVLQRATVVLASLFLSITLLLAIITGHRRPGRSVVETLPGQVEDAKPAEDGLEATPSDKVSASDAEATKADPAADSTSESSSPSPQPPAAPPGDSKQQTQSKAVVAPPATETKKADANTAPDTPKPE